MSHFPTNLGRNVFVVMSKSAADWVAHCYLKFAIPVNEIDKEFPPIYLISVPFYRLASKFYHLYLLRQIGIFSNVRWIVGVHCMMPKPVGVTTNGFCIYPVPTCFMLLIHPTIC